ncbi:MAG TPA: hypothetical protein VFV86_05175 [Nitrososphaeraceae archaeon]|nr:hypothetical protein [Nitrososphaeraceae archaeon]
MRVNLLLDDDRHILSGFLNLDPFATGKDERVVSDINNFDKYVDDAEAEVLIARHILCWFPTNQVAPILHYWFKKIKLGGVLIIEECDFENIAFHITDGSLGLGDAQKLLWGPQDKQWNMKKSGLSVLSLAEYLENSNFKILKKRNEQYNFVIEAMRLA